MALQEARYRLQMAPVLGYRSLLPYCSGCCESVTMLVRWWPMLIEGWGQSCARGVEEVPRLSPISCPDFAGSKEENFFSRASDSQTPTPNYTVQMAKAKKGSKQASNQPSRAASGTATPVVQEPLVPVTTVIGINFGQSFSSIAVINKVCSLATERQLSVRLIGLWLLLYKGRAR